MLLDDMRKRIADSLCRLGFHLFWKEHHTERSDYRICGMKQVGIGGRWV